MRFRDGALHVQLLVEFFLVHKSKPDDGGEQVDVVNDVEAKFFSLTGYFQSWEMKRLSTIFGIGIRTMKNMGSPKTNQSLQLQAHSSWLALEKCHVRIGGILRRSKDPIHVFLLIIISFDSLSPKDKWNNQIGAFQILPVVKWKRTNSLVGLNPANGEECRDFLAGFCLDFFRNKNKKGSSVSLNEPPLFF